MKQSDNFDNVVTAEDTADIPATNEDNSDDDISSVDSNDSCFQMIQFQSIRNREDLEEAIIVSWPMKTTETEDENDTVTATAAICNRYKSLHLSTLLEPDDMAPLFSGAEWAGTRVWHAAIRAIEYLDRHHHTDLKGGSTLLELGCGLGVPGMIACQLGAEVLLTDQINIMSQLSKNVLDNFPNNSNINSLSTTIDARPLSWSRDGVMKLLGDLGKSRDGFDIVLNCDCVFEPLYGDSWKLLVEVLDQLLKVNPNSIVLTSVERRSFDGIDHFLEKMDECDHISNTKLIHVDHKNNIELYLTCGIS